MKTTLCVFVKLDTRDLVEKPVERESETVDGYDFRVKQSVISLRSLLSRANDPAGSKLYIASR